MSPKTAIEITAENSDYVENADEEGLRWEAAQAIAFTQWMRASKSLLIRAFRVFRVLRVFRGNSHRRFEVYGSRSNKSPAGHSLVASAALPIKRLRHRHRALRKTAPRERGESRREERAAAHSATPRPRRDRCGLHDHRGAASRAWRKARSTRPAPIGTKT